MRTISKNMLLGCLLAILQVCFLAGCNGTPHASTPATSGLAPEKTEAAEALKTLPTTVLTGVKVQKKDGSPYVVVALSASGAFGSNIVEKAGPDRLIVILHNMTKGEAPPQIAVHDGTIEQIDIAELDTGKGPAVKVTIGLTGKTAHDRTTAENSLLLQIRKRS